MTKPTGRPRGRPTKTFTQAQRDDVAIWKAGGMSDEDIAKVLGIDADTMKKHFAAELSTHWAKKTAQVIKARFKAAMKGNVTAQTKFLETARAVGGMQAFGGQGASVKPDRKFKHIPEGKKEAAQKAAHTAGEGTEWEGDLQYPGATTVQ